MSDNKTTTLNQYPATKPSGIPWLESLPNHWGPTRIQHLASPEAKSFTDGDWIESPYITTEGIRLIQTGNVGVGEFVEKGYRYITDATFEELNCTEVEPGDILICRLGDPVARACAAPHLGKRMITSVDVCIVKSRKGLNSRFAIYAMSSRPYLDWVTSLVRGSTRDRISRSMLGKFVIPLPPPYEQAAIVRFLDHADEQIQRYIASKERLIALLGEERQALVHQAVTRGLDPNVRLKPSGMEWLGNVPEHWETCRLRNVVSEVTTGSRGWSSYASDSGPLFMRVANLNRGSLQLRFDDVVRLNLPDTSEVSRTRIWAGDLLISVTAFIGSVGIASKELGEAYVSQHVARCRPHTGLSSQWLGYVLLSQVGQTHGQMSLYGGTKDGLSLDDVKNYPILLPPRAEQNDIVEYLTKISVDNAAVIDQARRQVDLMNEYGTRLIADVVTGQLDVREAAEELPTPEPTEITD